MPDQHGAFLFVNDWAFNSDSLGVAEEFRPSAGLDVLLVGDSVVYGGNKFRQHEKLAPLVASRTGWKVWPASAGSWGLQNELTFLRHKPYLVRDVDVVVFIVNSGDFKKPSEWRSIYSHPRKYPSLYLPYLFRRYVTGEDAAPPSPFPVPKRNLVQDWTDFVRNTNKPVLVVSYSTQAQTGLGCNWTPESLRAVGQWSCYDGMKVAGPSGFGDAIHPSQSGNQKLAEHIIAMVEQSSAALSANKRRQRPAI